MASKIKCPSCDRLNEIDNKFCIFCGCKFQLDENAFKLLVDVPDDSDELKNNTDEFIYCPKCNILNFKDNIECSNCGYLLKKDVNMLFESENRGYKRCPECGNILSFETNCCNICGYNLLNIEISHSSFRDFLERNPEYEEYGKNISFFKTINRYNHYDSFLLEFMKFAGENNIDTTHFNIGLVKCPECSDFFSFISPHFIINRSCPHCSFEFNLNVPKDVYCLNCGRPVMENQVKCVCGYEFSEVKCSNCGSTNPFINKYCISCSENLKNPIFHFPSTKPIGCDYKHGRPQLLIDNKFLKMESGKNPYAINGEIYAKTLRDEYLKTSQILDEIRLRWWIVSPESCKSCGGKISPLKDRCPVCDISHNEGIDEIRVRNLKFSANNYVKPPINSTLMSRAKWNYMPPNWNLSDYITSLAPQIGESLVNYRLRLFKEYGENCAISELIKMVWNNYFSEFCINCGEEISPHEPQCPSCGMQRDIGGYCDIDCYYCFEEIIDPEEGIVGGYTDNSYSEYHCSLGHSIFWGRYCKDYE